MAKVTVYGGSVFNEDNLLIMLNVVNADLTKSAKTTFSATTGIDIYVAGGTGFTYKNGHVTDGTLKSLDWFENKGSVDIQLRDVKIDLKALSAAFDTGIDAIGKIVAKAFAGADMFTGSSGKDEINAFGGNDYVLGQNGNDTLSGGNGNDTVYGGLGNDAVYGDRALNEVGNDILRGDEGNDTLYGGAGQDKIWGGDGTDVFAFSSSKEFMTTDIDQIMDFKQSQGDKIDLTGFQDDIVFIGKDAFNAELGNQVRYVQKNGDTFIQFNKHLDFDTTPDMVIQLEGKINLVASDFIL
ncbi:calcium-binding protein [Rhizobium alvei]|uniref:Type I secretion C-terminal target domain-containing protein n=1 Tax=Rhizobium alvei TaxID=1132659 RepID=A0ABT8YHQ6_9HYPH|nr:type I secretion C-terminal target domain-containing protein [Rhizobium alvei]MDO6963227.1 type I secretion C-terminal target domain-containing protein [Rhizobium alvei]